MSPALSSRGGEPGSAAAPLPREVLRNLRHELRTPLNHILGYSELLLEEAADREASELTPPLQTICATAQQALGVLTDLLDPAKLEAGTGGPYAACAARLPLVDDNELNRDMLARRLVRLGYTVVTAENGRQALDLLATTAVDLILLDIMMPVMNGYEVLEVRRGDPRLRDVPCVVISALDEVDSVVRCVEMGAEDYLPKPFNPVF